MLYVEALYNTARHGSAFCSVALPKNPMQGATGILNVTAPGEVQELAGLWAGGDMSSYPQ
jgi:hypothetical protein